MGLSTSVIIPTVNESANVSSAVDSAWHAGADQVIVADGGSHDETVTRAQQRHATVIHASLGRAVQLNAGAEAATGEILVFQHADCRLTHDCLHQIRQVLAHTTFVYGAFQQRIDDQSRIYGWLARGNAARVRWTGLAYGDQGIFVTREVFESADGFPPVPLMEDVMLMQRLKPYGKPALLPGPIEVSARRWKQQGVISQTLRNWCLLTAFFCGVSPTTLSRFYLRHDQ